VRKIFLFLIIFFAGASTYSQGSFSDTTVSIPMFYGFYGYQWPGADMKEHFGSNSVIGPGFLWKTHRNWLWGAEYNFLFSRNVNMGFELLENIMTSDGNIINGDGVPATVALYERGHIFGLKLGKLFPVLSPNPNSGFFITISPAFLSHKIRIEVENNSAPQLRGDYKRGYDRLFTGFALSQSVGYMFFGNSRLFNFYAAFEIVEAWTSNYRQYNFDTRQPADEKRFDVVFGPKVGWIIPLRKRMPREYYYY
jgi:hypothetical protein